MRKTLYNGCIVMFGVIMLAMNLIPVMAQDETTELVYDPSVCAGSADLEELTADCLAMIEAFPRPVVEPIAQDRFTLSNYSFWRIGPDATALHDAPGGNVIGEIAAGFNFVNVLDLSVEGWLQIEGGQWISREVASYREPSYFTGVEIPDGLEHPFAFVLDLSHIFVSAEPGGPALQSTGRFLERYELVNIFDVAEDTEGWRWYMIGPNQWVKQTFVGKVQPAERPEGVSGRWVAVDLYEQTLVAYEDDTPVFATLIASGIPPFDTNEGLFQVWASMEADPMSGAAGAPEAYALQMVPWVMYFDDGISLHGTYWHDLFGYRQSHGCVNLTVSDAKYIFNFFAEAEPNAEDEAGEPVVVNHVYVHSSGEYGEGVIRQ